LVGFQDNLEVVSTHRTITTTKVLNLNFVLGSRQTFCYIVNRGHSAGQFFIISNEDFSVVDIFSTKYPICMVKIGVCPVSLITRWHGVGFSYGVQDINHFNYRESLYSVTCLCQTTSWNRVHMVLNGSPQTNIGAYKVF
jgi:hypothetical protein